MAGIYHDCAEALAALARGPGHFACHDYDTVREVVMCDAWHRHETPGDVTPKTFGEAVHESWQDIRRACESQGGIEHETGTPVDRAEDFDHWRIPQVDETYDLMDESDHTAGKIVVQSDGAITVCVHGDCHTDFIQPHLDMRETVLDAMRDIFPSVGYHLVDEGSSAIQELPAFDVQEDYE